MSHLKCKTCGHLEKDHWEKGCFANEDTCDCFGFKKYGRFRTGVD